MGDDGEHEILPTILPTVLPEPAELEPSPDSAGLGLEFSAQLFRLQQARARHDSLERDPEVVQRRAASFADLSDQRSTIKRMRDQWMWERAAPGAKPAPDTSEKIVPTLDGRPPLYPTTTTGPDAKPDWFSRATKGLIRLANRIF